MMSVKGKHFNGTMTLLLIFLGYFYYLKKNKSRLMRSSCCLCVSPLINFQMPEPICMKFGMYIMVFEPASMAYFKKPFHQSVCLYVYPPINARQWLSKHILTAPNIRNRRIVGRIIFYVVHVISKESL
jgi:hypothetical protein